MRYRGYIVGSETRPGGRLVWKVRIKEAGNPHDGQKFTVASIHGGLELARGLNVTFVLGTVDDETGEKVMRAVDVRLEGIPDVKPQQDEQ